MFQTIENLTTDKDVIAHANAINFSYHLALKMAELARNGSNNLISSKIIEVSTTKNVSISEAFSLIMGELEDELREMRVRRELAQESYDLHFAEHKDELETIKFGTVESHSLMRKLTLDIEAFHKNTVQKIEALKKKDFTDEQIKTVLDIDQANFNEEQVKDDLNKNSEKYIELERRKKKIYTEAQDIKLRVLYDLDV